MPETNLECRVMVVRFGRTTLNLHQLTPNPFSFKPNRCTFFVSGLLAVNVTDDLNELLVDGPSWPRLSSEGMGLWMTYLSLKQHSECCC